MSRSEGRNDLLTSPVTRSKIRGASDHTTRLYIQNSLDQMYSRFMGVNFLVHFREYLYESFARTFVATRVGQGNEGRMKAADSSRLFDTTAYITERERFVAQPG